MRPPIATFFALCVALAAAPHGATAQVLFTDDFENGLAGWDIHGGHVIETVEGGDGHGRVLRLATDGWDILALIRGSAGWSSVRVDGAVLFPHDGDAYLGLVYGFREVDGRTDFGNIYIKGDGSYLRANPHRDGNVGRTLYEEYNTPLTGESAIRIDEWQRFRMEIVGGEAHVYIGDMRTPRLTFDLYEHAGGAIGFQPRSIGWPVQIDDVMVTAIDGFSWRGPPIPDPAYAPDSLLTDWDVAGPYPEHRSDLERGGGATDSAWRPFETDRRGAIVTGRVTAYAGENTVAYFRTRVTVRTDTTVALHVSSVDDLVLFVNRRFRGFYAREGLAWHDFWRDPAHAGRRIPIRLYAGENELMVRVRGGTYATGGFFARLEPLAAPVVLPFD